MASDRRGLSFAGHIVIIASLALVYIDSIGAYVKLLALIGASIITFNISYLAVPAPGSPGVKPIWLIPLLALTSISLHRLLGSGPHVYTIYYTTALITAVLVKPDLIERMGIRRWRIIMAPALAAALLGMAEKTAYIAWILAGPLVEYMLASSINRSPSTASTTIMISLEVSLLPIIPAAFVPLASAFNILKLNVKGRLEEVIAADLVGRLITGVWLWRLGLHF